MKHMEHKHWIKLLDVVENPDQICLVMEYASCGDLYTHIVSSPGGRLPEKDAREIFYQAAEGVQYLHRCGFIHRDIKPENILLGKKNHVYIADLGYGTVWEHNKITNTPCGSLYYASPEIVKHDGVYIGPEVDVWSLGCVLYVMVTGRLPFHGSDPDTTRKLIIQGDFAIPYHISPELRGLINAMLETDGMERYSMEKVMAHPWVTAGKSKGSPKRNLTRRRSFGASFATFMGGLSFSSSKSKEVLSEVPEDDQKEAQEKGKDKKEAKEKRKADQERKKLQARGRRRSNSTASATIPNSAFAIPKIKGISTGDDENEKEKDTKKAKPDAKPPKKRHSGIFSMKLAAISEEGDSEEADSVGALPKKNGKRSDASGDEEDSKDKKDKKGKKKKRSSKRMSSSYGCAEAWGLPSIAEDEDPDSPPKKTEV